MTLRIALRSLASRPVRSAALAGGFGLGIAVMACLLGIGEVILEQAKDPRLDGGGHVVITGATGRIGGARFLLSGPLQAPPLADDVVTASPRSLGLLYLVGEGEPAIPIYAEAGIPSLERSLHDPETAASAAWVDSPADRAWSSPEPADVLRSLDRFHAIPDAPRYAGSWAEWLYFNGRAGDARFYLTFLTGRRIDGDRLVAGVRVQLERDGQVENFAESGEVLASKVLEHGPDLRIGNNSVTLEGMTYRIRLDLGAQRGSSRLRGEIRVEATPGRSIPPLEARGANGWISGYVVPVLDGALAGTIDVDGETTSLDGGTAYHDHNWGFWEEVSWQWGQVDHDGLAFVYGRIRPPRDAADPDRVPGFLGVIDEGGLAGFATRLEIEERDAPGSDVPERILVRGRSGSLDLTLELDVGNAVRTRMDPGPRQDGAVGLELLQMRARYRVTGSLGGSPVGFQADGSAETFRGTPRPTRIVPPGPG